MEREKEMCVYLFLLSTIVWDSYEIEVECCQCYLLFFGIKVGRIPSHEPGMICEWLRFRLGVGWLARL